MSTMSLHRRGAAKGGPYPHKKRRCYSLRCASRAANASSSESGARASASFLRGQRQRDGLPSRIPPRCRPMPAEAISGGLVFLCAAHAWGGCARRVRARVVIA